MVTSHASPRARRRPFNRPAKSSNLPAFLAATGSALMTKHMQPSQPAAERVEERPPLFVRRVDAIPVALPLTKPMKMAGVTIATADNVLVRVEAEGADGTIVGW